MYKWVDMFTTPLNLFDEDILWIMLKLTRLWPK